MVWRMGKDNNSERTTDETYIRRRARKGWRTGFRTRNRSEERGNSRREKWTGTRNQERERKDDIFSVPPTIISPHFFFFRLPPSPAGARICIFIIFLLSDYLTYSTQLKRHI